MLKILKYDFDLNPRYPSRNAKRWVIRRHVEHTGLGRDLELVREYTSKQSASRAADRLNHALHGGV